MSTRIYSTQNNRKSKGRILVPSDNYSRNIGNIKDGIFTKFNFQSKKHICYRHQAIGLDQGAFTDYILPNATLIVCPDKRNHITYRITVSQFKQVAIKDDLGWGTQLFCPIKYFQTDRSHQSDMQLALNFGGIANG